MKVIHKYDVPIEDVATVPVRRGAKLISAHAQRPNDHQRSGKLPRLQVWAEVDDTEPLVPTKFCIRGTGHRLTGAEGQFLATCILHDGNLVFHVYLHA